MPDPAPTDAAPPPPDPAGNRQGSSPNTKQRPWWLRLDRKPNIQLPWVRRVEPPPLTPKQVWKIRLVYLFAILMFLVFLALRWLEGGWPYQVTPILVVVGNTVLLWPNQRRQVLGLKRKPTTRSDPGARPEPAPRGPGARSPAAGFDLAAARG